MKACEECSGMAWIGEGDTASPCPTCNPGSDGKPPVPPTPEKTVTLSWVDSPGKSTAEDVGEPEHAIFSPQERERQARRDGPQG